MLSESEAPIPAWTELPEDLMENILQRLSSEEILKSVEKVCTTWWRACKNPALWRVVSVDHRRCTPFQFEYVVRAAARRGQAQLVELKLYTVYSRVYCCAVLSHVAQRASQLRRLTLSELETTFFTRDLHNFPQLEELHLFVNQLLKLPQFETIGVSCPMLKSFTYACWYDYLDFAQFAQIITKTMPNLRHLRLFVREMKVDGLEAILDGCPHLESLMLPQSCGLDLQGPLGKRCARQIKHLWLHPDSSEFTFVGPDKQTLLFGPNHRRQDIILERTEWRVQLNN
ncbi:putative F-box/LRR-repeat protein 23 [Salvia splendens]|uniref:putative F-box/LRR-repeat protein 23 n=1 Tax=Salvia splendens TaxID=180675 RepID=UPI001C266514|nr:putative F-box/LRR-repeat protein 23 [Salvia splendens]